ncbi:hypothetical protein Tcan_10214 [Toxocara canis]|uniref:Uncharacterized protein n=1 Tax=Toxocara canis TaxID=6265 RepID=A0A0B2UMW8_TOXCA|nr:hypothetical protein Tcan_10214 [Toxocara canis]
MQRYTTSYSRDCQTPKDGTSKTRLTDHCTQQNFPMKMAGYVVHHLRACNHTARSTLPNRIQRLLQSASHCLHRRLHPSQHGAYHPMQYQTNYISTPHLHC